MNNKGTKISVIIPCYNVELYIDECLNSIVNQTIGIHNLEIILVNDASTDSTLDKLLQWEQKFPDNIMVITYDENIRQGGARNVGLQYATSDYVGFIDSDDWVELDMYEKLYIIANSNDCDVVKGKFERNNEWKEPTENYCTNNNIIKYHFTKKDKWYDYKVDNTGVNGEFGSACTGIYKREIIINNNVLFPEKTAYEDNFWGSILHLYTKDLYIVDSIIYHYRNNTDSTVHDYSRLNDRLDMELSLIDEYKRLGAFGLFYDRLRSGFIERYYLNTLFMAFTKFIDKRLPFSLTEMKNNIIKYFPDYKKCDKYINCSDSDKVLFLLLDIPRELTEDEIIAIKKLYFGYIVARMSGVKQLL